MSEGSRMTLINLAPLTAERTSRPSPQSVYNWVLQARYKRTSPHTHSADKAQTRQINSQPITVSIQATEQTNDQTATERPLPLTAPTCTHARWVLHLLQATHISSPTYATSLTPQHTCTIHFTTRIHGTTHAIQFAPTTPPHCMVLHQSGHVS